MKKILVILIASVMSISSYAQQEPIYTQYGMNQAMFNPAYAGVNNVMSFSLMSRVQWAGLNGAPFTNTIIGTSSFFNNKGGVGVVIQSNTYGVSTNLEAFAQASYKLQLGLSSYISVGIQGGYLSYRNDFTKIPEADLDPVFGTVENNVSEPNVGMGVFFNTDVFYLGLSIPKFIAYSSAESGSDLLNYERRYYGSIGAILPMGLLKLKVSGLTIITGDDFSYDLGASLLMAETIWAGIFTRNFNAFGALGQIEVTDRLRLGLTVELPSTELVANQYGSYEVFISWEMGALRRQLLKRRYF